MPRVVSSRLRNANRAVVAAVADTAVGSGSMIVTGTLKALNGRSVFTCCQPSLSFF